MTANIAGIAAAAPPGRRSPNAPSVLGGFAVAAFCHGALPARSTPAIWKSVAGFWLAAAVWGLRLFPGPRAPPGLSAHRDWSPFRRSELLRHDGDTFRLVHPHRAGATPTCAVAEENERLMRGD